MPAGRNGRNEAVSDCAQLEQPSSGLRLSASSAVSPIRSNCSVVVVVVDRYSPRRPSHRRSRGKAGHHSHPALTMRAVPAPVVPRTPASRRPPAIAICFKLSRIAPTQGNGIGNFADRPQILWVMFFIAAVAAFTSPLA